MHARTAHVNSPVTLLRLPTHSPTQVTHASEDSWVVCHLIKDHIVACLVMQDTLKQLAERFPKTKFVEIISTDCIPNYPDSNLPTLIVYHKKKCIKTIAGAMQFGALPTPESESAAS